MLVLTRRIDESLIIGGNIIVTVLAIEGEKVKIGISAPREVSVYRKELWVAIQEQNKIAEKLASSPAEGQFDNLREFLSSESKENNSPEG